MSFQPNEPTNQRFSPAPTTPHRDRDAQQREPSRLDAWANPAAPMTGHVPDVMDFLADLDRRRSTLLERLRTVTTRD
jgi:hypothetical protein